MNDGRWRELMTVQDSELTDAEFEEGWHFCPEWDGLLVGPGMKEKESCVCVPVKGISVTPELLLEFAEWFDSPSKSPAFSVEPQPKSTPGMLLRRIVDAWKEIQKGD